MLRITRTLPAFQACRLSYSAVRWATKAPDTSFSSKSQIPVSGETNIKSETNRLEKTLTKFWERVDVAENGSGHFEVQLNGKPLRTPLGNGLSVPPTKKQLAYLISHEWESLVDVKIKPSSLPLTSMVSRVIDLEKVHGAHEVDQDMVMKIGSLQDIKYNMLKYLDTDTCVIFATADEYEGKFRAKQDELYLPLLEEYENFFTEWARSQNLLPTPDYQVKLSVLDCETDGIRGNTQSLTVQNIVLLWLDNLPIYDLVALEKAILSSKSFLCGASVVRSNAEERADLYQVNKVLREEYFVKTVEEIIELGNLETIFQTEEWGEVEDTHDVDGVEWVRSLAASALVCR